MDLGWTETCVGLVLAIGLFIWSNWVARQPTDPVNPRLWSPVMVMGFAAVVALLMLAHMITLSTGKPFQGGGF